MLLFPGALPVRFDTPYLRLDPATRAVGFGVGRRLAVRIEAPGRPTGLLTARSAHALRACAAAGQLVDRPARNPSPRYVPGSLRGRLASLRCTYRVTSEAAGAIAITGTAFVRGSYRTLDYENVARTDRGRIVLPVDASGLSGRDR